MITLTKKQAEEGYIPIGCSCSDCVEGKMIVRKNRHTDSLFLACNQFPECRHAEAFITEDGRQVKFEL
jgi:ssDNA-binding Zn-finger/Zn-ribbon topoisomerase 1